MSVRQLIPKLQYAAVSASAAAGVAIKQIPVTQPEELGQGRALVKILYSGVCHTDLHVIKDDWPLTAVRPCIAGHEGVGNIVAINDASSKFKLGQKVGIKWIADSCNQCNYCLEGNESLCPHAQCSGLSVPGTFQQYCAAFTSQLTPIPDGIDLPQVAPILCAGVTVYKGLKRSGTRAGQSVLVMGAGGGLGSLAVQYAKYMGLSVIAVDTGAEKKALCEKFGAAAWIDFKDTKDMAAAIKAATPDGMGPHAAIVVSPKTEAYTDAMNYIRPRGTVVAMGLPAGKSVVPADVFWTTIQEKTLVGSYVGNRLDAIEALQIAAEGHVTCPVVVKPLKDLPQVFEDMEAAKLAGRVVLDLSAEA